MNERIRLRDSFAGVFVILALSIGIFVFTGCATTEKKSAKKTVETREVCPSAKITAVDYSMKKSKFSGGPKLHMKVGIKNISSQPKRYRVSIFLPNGASSGGFYPRKGKPPVIKPGETKERTFPMYYDRIPDAVTIKVDEL
jgi:hypothetical protein